MVGFEQDHMATGPEDMVRDVAEAFPQGGGLFAGQFKNNQAAHRELTTTSIGVPFVKTVKRPLLRWIVFTSYSLFLVGKVLRNHSRRQVPERLVRTLLVIKCKYEVRSTRFPRRYLIRQIDFFVLHATP